ncbi:lipoyl(octanoyl) transferase LipB [Lampropedia aestuarii]|uniref:lipoyl(octanoyl) transferase LipB n=1 Tax=Lampropedia aestuarii TaxID=2562762 RepID=UPI0023EF54B1|nr:lipoyl(octanoyl) transferase LipB [Lampropedia aestuarii]MDH5858320.1 lipoyl(octanoyl) transferase LipB [Lampropedia aestuarii]
MHVIVKQLGMAEYLPTIQAMEAFTAQRTLLSEDELWLCEHAAVFTLGQGAKPEHLLNPGTIPVVQTARGGQVTYHGPGQLVAYPLLNLKQRGIFIKEYVRRLEQVVIDTLLHFGIAAQRIAGAPGVYVRTTPAHSPAPTASPLPSAGPSFTGMAKIAALGIKVSKSCAYHGLALNVAMDLQPYSRINPCGYQHLATTDMHTMGASATVAEVSAVLSALLAQQLAPPPSIDKSS